MSSPRCVLRHIDIRAFYRLWNIEGILHICHPPGFLQEKALLGIMQSIFRRCEMIIYKGYPK